MNGEMRGSTIIIRPLHESYFNQYLLMLSPVVQQALHVTDMRSELSYLHDSLQKMARKETFFYCIFNRATEQLIGAIEIRQYANGQLYSWLNECFWGKGFFQEALNLVSRCYFQATGNLFFNVRVDVSNKRSYKALKKSGAADIGFYNGPRGKQFELILRKKN